MDVEKTINYWLVGAKNDLEAAEVLFDARKYPQSLFWCHLLLEKTLKALVVFHTKTQAPYSHNLVQLSGKTGVDFSDEQKTQLKDISEFNLMGRYADETETFALKCTSEFSQKYFSIAKNLYQWLLTKISSP